MEPYSFIDDEGLFIFGIPGIILFLPVIALSDALWHTVSRITNMNHNHYLFYNRIKGSLDLETSQILKDCLINLSKEDT